MKPDISCEWIEMSSFLSNVPSVVDSPESVAMAATMTGVGRTPVTPSMVLPSATPSPSSRSPSLYGDVEVISYPLLPSPEKPLEIMQSLPSKGPLFDGSPLGNAKAKSPPRAISPSRPGGRVPFGKGTGGKAEIPSTPVALPISGDTKARITKLEPAEFADLYSRLSCKSLRSTSRNNLKSEHYRSPKKMDSTAAEVSAVSAPKPLAPVSNAERILHLGRVMGYQGGPALLILDGKLAVFTSGPLIVLLDVESCSDEMIRNGNPGIWRNFATISTVNITPLGKRPCGEDGFRQAFLRGHSRRIVLLEISSSGRLMASCEGGADAALILWDMKQVHSKLFN